MNAHLYALKKTAAVWVFFTIIAVLLLKYNNVSVLDTLFILLPALVIILLAYFTCFVHQKRVNKFERAKIKTITINDEENGDEEIVKE